MFGIVKRESYLKKLEEEYKNSGSTDTYLEWLEKEYHKTDAYLKHLKEKEAELKREDFKQEALLACFLLFSMVLLVAMVFAGFYFTK